MPVQNIEGRLTSGKKFINKNDRLWACTSVTKEEYEKANSIFKLYLKDPTRVDLGECMFVHIVKYVPYWIHPNQLTMCTLVCNTIMLISALAINAVSNDIQRGLLCLIAAICNFGTLTFDCLDGMHARGTKQTSELGSLLDHWLDSLGVAMNAGAVALALYCDKLAIDFGVISAILTFHSQLLIYHHFHDFPRVTGVEAQLSCSGAFFLCALAYFFHLYRAMHVASWLLTIATVIVASTTIIRFWKRFTKPLIKHQFYYCSGILFGYCLLHQISFISTIEFILLCMAISHRFNGALVVRTLADKKVRDFDHIFIFGIILCFIENILHLSFFFRKFLVLILHTLSFTNIKSKSPMITDLHFVPWVILSIAFFHNIQELLNFIPTIVEKDKSNEALKKAEEKQQ